MPGQRRFAWLGATALAFGSSGCSYLTHIPKECRSFPSYATAENRGGTPAKLPLASKGTFRVGSCEELEMRDVTDARPIYGLGTARLTTLRVHQHATGTRFVLIDTGRGLRICENEALQETHAHPQPFEDWISWDLPGGRGTPRLPDTPPCARPRPAPERESAPRLTALPIVEGASCDAFGLGEWNGGSDVKIEGDVVVVTSHLGNPLNFGARVGAVILYRQIPADPVLEVRVCTLSGPANFRGTVQYDRVSTSLAAIRERLGARGLRAAPPAH